ncbi:hypothetical protein GTY51_39825 [Streptomyces sp. SID4936]|nr:hypothetical protein [Streptomyces sp. SID4936]
MAALNPVYGHGMTVAAQCAAAIRAVLRIEGLHPGVGTSIQRRVAQVVDTPWTMAEEQDRGFPGAKSNGLSAKGPMDRLARWYGDRLARAALTDPAVFAAYFDVFALTAPAARLAAPAVAFAALRPCRRRPPTAAEAIGRHRRVAELAGHP